MRTDRHEESDTCQSSPELPQLHSISHVAVFAYLTCGALMNMAGPVNTTFQMETAFETERASTSGSMVMADNVPRAIAASVSGALITGNDFCTPFVLTTLTYFSASSLFYIFFRKAEGNRKA